MFDSFSTLFSKIWNSLDDVLICVCLFALALKASRIFYWCTQVYFRQSVYAAEIVSALWLGTVVVYLSSHLIGEATAVSLFSGFSIGIGYAMQPYITSVVSSAALKAMNMLKKGDTLQMGGVDYEVHHVGLLYVCTKNDKYYTYFPVTRFLSAQFSVHRTTNRSSSY